MSKPLLIVILLVVAIGGGYLIFGTLKDAPTVTLEGVAKEMEISYPEIDEKEFDWSIEKEDNIQAISITGKGFEATEVPNDQYLKVDQYFLDQGFQRDVYNIAAGTVGELTGYKKDQLVCVVVSGFSGYKEAVGQWIPPDPQKKDVDAYCGTTEEEIYEELSKEEAITLAFANRYGRKISQISVAIEKETDTHARGIVVFQPGGSDNTGAFLAAKTEDLWTIAFDGQGVISCEEMAKFEFPEDMVEDCENTYDITVGSEEEFSIVLPSNPSTGYGWVVDFEEDFIELASQTFTPSSEEVGAGGVEVFTFDAVAEGETQITFSYLRPWESVQPLDVKVYSLTIEE
jgi:inhibitor of cysteine peptidase